MSDWMDVEENYYMHVVRRQPIVLVRGQGTTVWDEAGKEYLDFTGGWAVNNIGHCHPAVVEAITEQAQTLMQTSNAYYTIPQLKLARLLVENSCLDKVFFCNSGAEANEGAIKLARKYGRLHQNGAYEIITALNSFHGRTLAMIAATGQPQYQQNFQPLAPGFINVPYNDIDAIKVATTPNTCAIMLEPVQGEGGVNVPAENYHKDVRKWCDDNGLVLIMDEVQTGMGRLGSLFGYEKFGIEPDIITLAKGLGNGVPIGAFMSKLKTSVFEPGDHGSTFGGNVLTCAAAYAAAQIIVDEDISLQAQETGQYLADILDGLKNRHSNIREIRGMGLLRAIEFTDDLSPVVVAAANNEGVLLNAVRPNAVRIMPPLTITRKEIDTGVSRIEAALATI
mgnify:FL=1|jgi:predicted acetylornithine/succinylornithine family transaminase